MEYHLAQQKAMLNSYYSTGSGHWFKTNESRGNEGAKDMGKPILHGYKR